MQVAYGRARKRCLRVALRDPAKDISEEIDFFPAQNPSALIRPSDQRKPYSSSSIDIVCQIHQDHRKWSHKSWKKALNGLENNSHCDVSAYVALLRECGSAKALSDGKRVHNHIMRSAHAGDIVLGALLLQMYGYCGALEDACSWFASMPKRTVFVWNYMIAVCLRLGLSAEALQHFEQMQQEGMIPDKVTFINILSACASLTAIADGKRMNARIIGSGFGFEVVVVTALVNMYGKCGDLNHARRMFDRMSRRDVVTWNAMIAAYTQNGYDIEALVLFEKMPLEGIFPNRATFASILSACAHQGAIKQAKRMHARIIETGLDSDYVIANAIVHMYNKCGSLEDSERAFDAVSKLNVVAWNAMIGAYTQHGCLHEALELLDRMQHEDVRPDKINFLSILDACGSQQALAEGKQMHGCIRRSGYETDSTVANALISMYGRCGSLYDARRFFNNMLQRNVVSWNAMIAAYARNGHGKEALELFDLMLQDGLTPDKVTFISILDACATQAALSAGKWIHTCILPKEWQSDVVVATALVNMYGKHGYLVDARLVFDLMPQRNVVSWTAMIAAYCLHGHDKDALQLFDRMMQEGMIPDEVTFLSIICACTNQGVLYQGNIVHTRSKYIALESEITISNALINMYGKCGSLVAACSIFGTMSFRNLATWNVMIAVCAQHGLGKAALNLFYQMQQEGMLPDKVTFVSILSACSHAGLVVKSVEYLLTMNDDHGVTPGLEHYDCIVDSLGRAGQLIEAESVINKMPFQPTAVSWMALFSACRTLEDVGQGKRSAEYAFELDSQDPVPYVMLSNLYAAVGTEEDAQTILDTMTNQHLPSKGLYACK